MRILLIIDCFLPSGKSSAKLGADLAHEFVRLKHQVTVLVPSDAVPGSVRSTVEDGVEVLRYRAGPIKNVPRVIRACNEMLLSWVALWRTRRCLADRCYDLIVYYSPSIFFGPLVAFYKKKWKAPAYLILRDIFPDWAVDAGLLKKGLVYRVFKGFEQWQYRVADMIGVETGNSVGYFAGTVHQGKVEVLRNWTATAAPAVRPPAFRPHLGLDGKTVFFYGGNIGVAQDMDNIMRLAKRMRGRPDVHFLFVGAGSEVDRLRRMIRDEGIVNVTLLDPVDQDTYLTMLNEFDVGLISLDRRLKSYSTTGKLLGYLQCGLPVLASVNAGNDLAELLTGGGAGLASLNGDDERLCQNALLLCDPARRAAMGANSRKLLLDMFSVAAVAGQILQTSAGQCARSPGQAQALKG